MTDFTDEQIESLRRHAAEKVMELPARVVRHETMSGADDTVYYELPDGTEIHEDDWRPDEDANQAEKMLAEMGHWAGNLVHGKYQVYVSGEKGEHISDRFESFPLAALIACCRATGWQE